jgi:hypothetical protein
MNAADRGALTFWLALLAGFGSVVVVVLINDNVGVWLDNWQLYKYIPIIEKAV